MVKCVNTARFPRALSNCTHKDKIKQLSKTVKERGGENCRQHQGSTVTKCNTLRVKKKKGGGGQRKVNLNGNI